MSSSLLPAAIDPSIASTVFQRQRRNLLRQIFWCFPSINDALYAEGLVPQDVYETVREQVAHHENNASSRGLIGRAVGKHDRTAATSLVDCMTARVQTDFVKIVHVLESYPDHLMSTANQLVQDYCFVHSLRSDDQNPLAASTTATQYAAYLKDVYSTHPSMTASKWLPSPTKDSFELALLKYHHICDDSFIKCSLRTNIREPVPERACRACCGLDDRVKITMDQMLQPSDRQDLKLVVIEGIPGIGKSTLASVVSKNWKKIAIVKDYSLVILLKLREETVQKIACVADLFYNCNAPDRKALVHDANSCDGKGVLFVLDGLDELPENLQQKSFLMDLIKKKVLPDSMVVVTSRPSTAADLLSSLRPKMPRRIEMMGFTRETVEEYAASIFSDPKEVEGFKEYIYKYPAVNCTMCIPVTAAIIVQTYAEMKSKSSLPVTLTQLYTQLSLAILNDYIKSERPAVGLIQNWSDLPDDLYKCFLNLGKVALGGMENQQVVFSVPPSTCHFGFLDAVPALYEGSKVSYNFLHLTLQEFLAAFYISQLPDRGSAHFKKYNGSDQWNMVWRFVSGLTEFHFLPSNASSSSFVFANDKTLTPLFIQCLFEAQSVIDFESIFGVGSQTFKFDNITVERNGCLFNAPYTTPLNCFALGYCIVNRTTEQSIWSVYCGHTRRQTDSFDSFFQALDTNPSCKNVIATYSHHSLYSIEKLHGWLLKSETPLSRVRNLILKEALCSWKSLAEIVPHFNDLEELNLNYTRPHPHKGKDYFMEFLQQLSDSKVTSLIVTETNIEYYLKRDFRAQPAFQALKSKKLLKLSM